MNPNPRKPTIFWYDLETFGLDSRHDRIAQFAGQRTDYDLNPIGEPVVLYNKLSDDYLPDPLSCLITGITPQEVNEKGLCESDLIEQINREFATPNTVVAGFNNIRFDDEFIRNALYRNFMDPYKREWDNNCSRWDIIDLVRAAYDLRPEGIAWPPRKEETGNPTFRLTALTEANSIPQEGAHDALVDVKATIAIARLIKEKQPKLYSYYFTLRNKTKVKDVVQTPFGEPVLLTASFFSNKQGCSRLITPITHLKENPNSILCFDLTKDTAPLFQATAETIFKVDGVFTIAVNKCPFVSPLSVLSDSLAIKLGLDKPLALFRHEQIANNTNLLLVGREISDTFESVKDVDFQLYDGFFPNSDLKRFELIRKATPKDKLRLNLDFEDNRCAQMLFRHVGRNWSEVLDEEQRRKWRSFCANRILNPPGTIKINLNFYKRKVEENLASTDFNAEDKLVLAKLKEYGLALEKSIFG
ncbi:exodeoxyribonuclease I [Sphaerochaeta sp. PS]|uniref:exodeoxyribonuclease I n=1 Tax=Sphaerochaeta sp. PS TaxID=3076336 RepID=UPI0028A4AA00|nr:exodeoxyribonuclease I [Sphaerochaeta sp. PS]MDT4762283.1 exodeoxyribonuclease I [Sphaerochaeta sp. PS]